MASHIVGYPRMGPKRGLKFALESFWDGKSSADDLKKVAADLRSSIWKQMAAAGIKYIPSNTFSYYDQVLDTTAMLGAVPPRYGWHGGEIGFDTYFSMARGNASVPAMEMTKWFDTNYHFIVPELGPEVNFSYASHKAVDEYKEAKALGVDTVPVLIGPVSYLLLSKPAKGVEKSFPLLSLLGKILPIYKEVISELKAAGASRIQLDEPTLVLDLESHKLQAFSGAYAELESTLSGLNVLIETYFADIPAEAYKTLTALKGVTAFGFDWVRGTRTIDLIKIGETLHMGGEKKEEHKGEHNEEGHKGEHHVEGGHKPEHHGEGHKHEEHKERLVDKIKDKVHGKHGEEGKKKKKEKKKKHEDGHDSGSSDSFTKKGISSMLHITELLLAIWLSLSPTCFHDTE
ncbi:hypothetical protein SLEP1_g19348 [Rubroshorea leprosula]|nr:hypothetical protein SLEP1_g19348 [Rubroshorea leprosula]